MDKRIKDAISSYNPTVSSFLLIIHFFITVSPRDNHVLPPLWKEIDNQRQEQVSKSPSQIARSGDESSLGRKHLHLQSHRRIRPDKSNAENKPNKKINIIHKIMFTFLLLVIFKNISQCKPTLVNLKKNQFACEGNKGSTKRMLQKRWHGAKHFFLNPKKSSIS